MPRVRRREQTKALSLHEILAECFGVVSASTGLVPLALSPRLGEIARREHARRAVEIPIQSLDIAPRAAPAHARGHFDPGRVLVRPTHYIARLTKHCNRRGGQPC